MHHILNCSTPSIDSSSHPFQRPYPRSTVVFPTIPRISAPCCKQLKAVFASRGARVSRLPPDDRLSKTCFEHLLTISERPRPTKPPAPPRDIIWSHAPLIRCTSVLTSSPIPGSPPSDGSNDGERGRPPAMEIAKPAPPGSARDGSALSRLGPRAWRRAKPTVQNDASASATTMTTTFTIRQRQAWGRAGMTPIWRRAIPKLRSPPLTPLPWPPQLACRLDIEGVL